MSGLVAILDESWNAVEADFQRFYSMDLRVEAERAGCRRLRALVDALPLDAMLWRSREPQESSNGHSNKRDEVMDFFKEHVH